MSFDVAAESYDRFMGRYSRPLAPQLADLAGVRAGQRALDVGSGPGALTAELVARLGAAAVTAVDPSASFVAAARARSPGRRGRPGLCGSIAVPGRSFDAALAQLVVHFMADPVAGLTEMRRVTRPGGVVAACVWDHAGEHGPLSVFWRAARALDPDVDDESHLAGVREGHLAELFATAGLARDRAGGPVHRASSTRASTSGGSRSRTAWVPPARTSPAWMRRAGPSCGRPAGWRSRRRRSRSQHAPGPPAVSPSSRRSRLGLQLARAEPVGRPHGSAQAGAPAGTTPSCCIIAMRSMTPQWSPTRPSSSKRKMSISWTSTALPVGGMPWNSPCWVPV